MTWKSLHQPHREYEPIDFSDIGKYDYSKVDYQNNKNKNMTSHNWKTLIGLALVFIVGGLQALNGVAGLSAYITMILPVLLVLEHIFYGNTGTTQ